MNQSDTPTAKQIIFAQLRAQMQNDYMNEHGEHSFNAVFFTYEGIDIHNPWTEETGRFEVNPLEYYPSDLFNAWVMTVNMLFSQEQSNVG